MSEDDTFAALMKPTWHEMRALFHEYICSAAYNETLHIRKTIDVLNLFFVGHHWTYADFAAEYKDHKVL